MGTNYGSFQNLMMSGVRSHAPVVGMGATKLSYTDRNPATVVRVAANGKTLWVTEDNAHRADKNGMSEVQDYLFTVNPEAPQECYTLRKNGKWVRQGESAKGGRVLIVGSRAKYHDYSF